MDAPRFLDDVTTDIIHYESKKVISSASIHRGELTRPVLARLLSGKSLGVRGKAPRG
jgi:hypothetical protein